MKKEPTKSSYSNYKAVYFTAALSTAAAVESTVTSVAVVSSATGAEASPLPDPQLLRAATSTSTASVFLIYLLFFSAGFLSAAFAGFFAAGFVAADVFFAGSIGNSDFFFFAVVGFFAFFSFTGAFSIGAGSASLLKKERTQSMNFLM